MNLSFKCPNPDCLSPLEMVEIEPGETAQCGTCNTLFLVPASATAIVRVLQFPPPPDTPPATKKQIAILKELGVRTENSLSMNRANDLLQKVPVLKRYLQAVGKRDLGTDVDEINLCNWINQALNQPEALEHIWYAAREARQNMWDSSQLPVNRKGFTFAKFVIRHSKDPHPGKFLGRSDNLR